LKLISDFISDSLNLATKCLLLLTALVLFLLLLEFVRLYIILKYKCLQ